MGQDSEAIPLSREDRRLELAVLYLMLASLGFSFTLTLLLLSPDPLKAGGSMGLFVYCPQWLVSHGILLRAPTESRVRPLAIPAFVTTLLGLAFFLLPSDLFLLERGELLRLRPSPTQLAQFLFLLLGFVFLLLATRRLALWLEAPALGESLVRVLRVLPVVSILFVIVRFAPLAPDAIAALGLVLWIALILGSLRLAFLFWSIRKRVRERLIHSVSQVFD